MTEFDVFDRKTVYKTGTLDVCLWHFENGRGKRKCYVTTKERALDVLN